MNWILCEDPGTFLSFLQPMEKCTQTRKPKKASSWQCKYSTKRLLFYRLELCEDHGFSYEWLSGQKPRMTKEKKTIICKTDNFVPLVVPGITHLFWEQFVVNIDTAGFVFNKSSSRAKWRTSSTSVVRITLRNKTKIKRGMTVEMRTTVCEIFLNGWRSSQIIQRTQNCMHLHTFLRTQIRNVLRKSYQNHNQGSTVFILTCKKTEIAKSACEPKWQGLLAADALAKFYFE